jgi:hypothetical protein
MAAICTLALVGSSRADAQEEEDWAVATADCIVTYESHWVASAYNPRSGAAGLGQFLYSTWLSTPQGKAGLSRYDPYAAHAAVVWMVNNGRAREFDAYRWFCS